ncbi:methyltransferase, partial [Bizionia sp.]|uniref:methyltransferase n=1 Tax=Bizionia sp. TaxID=1954480 RepID=UPI003A92FB3B
NIKENSFDLVVSNPPFHFEHENNIEVALKLFTGVENCLKNGERFLLVANSHLNYSTHLTKLFTSVSVLKQNKKFQIIECIKKR